MNMQQDFLDVPFETEREEATPAFPLLPRDRYKAEIVKAMAGSTKNGKGYSVNLTWSIVEGEHENRVVFQSILIQHESEEAQKYGRQKFKDVLVALGIKETVSDLSVLLNKPCLVGIVIHEDKTGQYQPKNEISRVMAIPNAPKANGHDAIKEAQKVQPAFKKVDADMNDGIPF